MIEVSRAWKEAFPQTFFAVLAMEGIENDRVLGEMEARKGALEEKLRQLWQGKTRKDLKAASPFGAYESHYRRFGQGYPVLAQVESVALKGKPIASVSPLVTALFMAELESGLLTAGHDLDQVVLPLRLDVATGEEAYRNLGGQERRLREGDMFLSDGRGILSSVLYGPDDRSFITSGTSRALFTVYGVPSVTKEKIRAHLEETERLLRVISPGAATTALMILP